MMPVSLASILRAPRTTLSQTHFLLLVGLETMDTVLYGIFIRKGLWRERNGNEVVDYIPSYVSIWMLMENQINRKSVSAASEYTGRKIYQA